MKSETHSAFKLLPEDASHGCASVEELGERFINFLNHWFDVAAITPVVASGRARFPVARVRPFFLRDRPGPAEARPGGSHKKQDDQCERADARREINLHFKRYRSPGFHRDDPPGCDAPPARKGCGVSAPRCALTGARGSIGPVEPKRFGETGIGLAWTATTHVVARVPDVLRLGGIMGVAKRFIPGRRADLLSNEAWSRVL